MRFERQRIWSRFRDNEYGFPKIRPIERLDKIRLFVIRSYPFSFFFLFIHYISVRDRWIVAGRALGSRFATIDFVRYLGDDLAVVTQKKKKKTRRTPPDM